MWARFIGLRMGRDSWQMFVDQGINFVFCKLCIYGKLVSPFFSLVFLMSLV